MIAESLRHRLGDLSSEDVDVYVILDGKRYRIVDTLERGREFYLLTEPKKLAKKT